MFFGLTNSPATFQAMMNKIFADEIREGHVVIYLDNILIFSTDLDEHHTLITQVLQKLQKNKLYLKPKKCEFERKTVNYLGMVVRRGEVCWDKWRNSMKDYRNKGWDYCLALVSSRGKRIRYDSVARLVIYVQNNRDIKYVPRLVLECRRQRKN